MISQVREPSASNLPQRARPDTIFVLIAVLLNLLMLATSSWIARESAENGTITAVLGLFANQQVDGT